MASLKDIRRRLLGKAEAWNDWRAANQNKILDLRGLHQSGAKLSGFNLSSVDLRGTRMVGTDLRNADLREANLENALLVEADLVGAKLRKAELRDTDFSGAKLIGVDLSRRELRGAIMPEADLSEAKLTGSNLDGADLRRAKLHKTHMVRVSLSKADLSEADLTGAKLNGANLRGAIMVDTCLDGADISDASVYGISAWNLSVNGTIQRNLSIGNILEQQIRVDDIEIAQFIHQLLNNHRLRQIIDTITSKVVLVLGSFSKERKLILDSVRDELRRRGYVPVLFDFQKPEQRDLTETISTFAHLARFVIADLTDGKSIPQELARIIPILPSVPIQPILLASKREWVMYGDLERYPWVLPIARYTTPAELLAGIQEQIIEPAERKAREQMQRTRPPRPTIA